jgi:hypothetical protein
MIASFTQTYGDKRILEIMLLKYDIIGNYFRNKCDYIIFSFHNCPPSFIEKAKEILNEIYPFEKLVYLEYENITYYQCIENLCKLLKEKKITYLLQIQDDQHGMNTEENCKNIKEIDTLFLFLRDYQPNFLHIYDKEGDKDYNKIIPIEEKQLNNTCFYQYHTDEFKKVSLWGWNDGTYFIKTDFFMEVLSIIDKKEQCVWWVEWNLRTLFDETQYLRWGMNQCYFKTSNLHGRNTSKNSPIENLERMFGKLTDWEEIKPVIQRYY